MRIRISRPSASLAETGSLFGQLNPERGSFIWGGFKYDLSLYRIYQVFGNAETNPRIVNSGMLAV